MQIRSLWAAKKAGFPALAAAVFALFGALAPPPAHAAEQALPRFPTLHGDTIVFEAGGNLWKVGIAGGEATRLTADPGYDQMPRFSPDGRWIAFTGEYAGQDDVYVMPASGGDARRLTYHSDVTPHAPLRWGPNNMVVTWTPDSKNVVFLSRRDTFNSWFGRLFEVPVTGGLPTLLPLPKGGIMSFNADGTKIAYNRIFRNFRTWKHYYGGLAQNVWIYDFKTKQIQQITHWKGTDTDPMWSGDTIYYLSDRGPNQTMNLWAYSLTTRKFRQVTHFKNYDIDWPSLGNTGIAFADEGKLYVLKLPSEQLVEVPVSVPNDGVRTQPYWYAASQMIRSADIAPNGKLAVFGARGDIFTVPAEHGDTTDITHSSGAREQYPSWSPEGKTIAYVTDASGESEIATRPATGGDETLLTSTKDRSYYGPTWSPDGKWLAFSDSAKTLWLMNVASKQTWQIAQDKWREMKDFSFSPDSGWITYSETQPNGMRALFIYGVDSHKNYQITNGWFDDSDPTFSRDGKYLYFVSARNQNPAFSSVEFNFANLRPDGLYVTTLQTNTPAPFAPRQASAVSGEPAKAGGKNAKDNEKNKTLNVAIDFKGLAERAVPIPVPTANIGRIRAAGGVVFYTTYPDPILGQTLPGEHSALMTFDMKTRKGKQLIAGVNGFTISANGKSLLYSANDNWYIRPADTSDGAGDKLDLSHMQMLVNPVAEWKEMYWNAWRLERNFFVNPTMNGKDWNAIGKRYAALLPLVTCREDLNYLIGEMIGSLQNSHTYVGGGYTPNTPSYVATGMLGADFALDAKSGRYYLSKIYRGNNTLQGYTAPLAQPNMKVSEGDYVLAINGRALKAPDNPNKYLVNTLGTTVTLNLANNPAGRNAWTIRVKPIANALPLWRYAWIQHNRKMVNKLSDGKVGYIYLSDMEELGMDQFIRQFYPQLTKQALIIDDRFNGGGFIDPILIERLNRRLVSLFADREQGPSPQNAIAIGYKAVLINHYSASDGDIFPWKFKQFKLGPAIGTRTWGGVRGIRGYWPLMDGGYITIPEESMYNPKSEWVVENIGVEPNVRVDDLPGAVMSGQDPQLDTAVHMMMEKIKANPRKLPPQPKWLPAYPPQPNYPPCPADTTCGGSG